MFLRTLHLRNYGVFEDARFDLATDVDRPLVVITGNNGAGKTSTLEAIRIALHGRRAFDTPVGEAEYLRLMSNRFRNGNTDIPCSINLEFDYVDQHRTRRVVVSRSWTLRRQRIAEQIEVIQDGQLMDPEDADDLLTTILQPEIARYFFFDGERIRELAEWGIEDESALFRAVGDLLGIGVLLQLKHDLLRIIDLDSAKKRDAGDVSERLNVARQSAETAKSDLRSERAKARGLRAALDRARTAVRRIGVLQQDEVSAAQERIGALNAERRALNEEFERAAHDVLPLICAKSLRKRFAKEIDTKIRLEEREIVNAFLAKNADQIKRELKAAKCTKRDTDIVFDVFESVARGKPLPITPVFANISRSDATWMQRVMESELPELAQRMNVVCCRLKEVEAEITRTEDRLRSVPTNDPAADAALLDLETHQRAFVEHEARLAALDRAADEASALLEDLEKLARQQRQEAFRAGRLRVRGQFMEKVLEALPTLTARLEASKEERFAGYLKDALNELWHKVDRLREVKVSFAAHRIELFDGRGLLEKRDLSAGEKQLFAIGFIYALAQLSGSRMPFVIDTPLGRLDKAHRRRFVAGFLPSASHQVILLSTDTEIVGPLFDDIAPLVAHHYELSEYNGGVTPPVQLALA
jgi:DNA sulfur modification protein DndD